VLKAFIARKALEWVNDVRREHGLPAIDRLEPGMCNRPYDCALARSLAPGQTVVEVDGAIVLGRRHGLPFWVRRFVTRFDWGQYDDLRSVRPSRPPSSIAHLDFTATSPASANGGTSSMRSPLQNRPGSYQLAGRRDGSSPMC
jgi:hypothetical protein